ncbi:HNH endonuclease signature motif containing protein [Xenorhabdus bovienii]|uniref:HNH endonuclease signature motif containing protein n=1 Tax=Xenorhabdus bovienii TaxID=40576 RepID=UPI0023B2F89D|nr:HNH endonuclease signature motif containing protein [Xenorhabdus bovienii]MDE9553487.1 HNH endonuclease [Xenorhabdus bovienii]
MARFEYSGEMKEWMKENYLLPRGELTTKFNEHFSTSRSCMAINNLRQRLGLRTGRTGQFSKGHRPYYTDTKGLRNPNSGSFKKGHSGFNKCKVGTERIKSDGHVYIKLINGKWFPKHRVIWESHHGKIPKNNILIFKDSDQKNCRIDNLIMITRNESGILNRCYHAVPTNYKQTAVYLARIKMAIANRS